MLKHLLWVILKCTLASAKVLRTITTLSLSRDNATDRLLNGILEKPVLEKRMPVMNFPVVKVVKILTFR